ncbi:hypothetical protein, partial [Pseudokineococcus sp. 1T1Z-3]|uniref:hypothetical protein n=1 Tax=Pseudokineococcus sp. 1T1Z-3 TaxID=3132745 RepID=UPI003099F11E
MTLVQHDVAAAASRGFPDVSSRFDRDSADLKGLLERPAKYQPPQSEDVGTGQITNGAGGTGQAPPEAPTHVSRLLPACGGENPNLGMVNECATQPTALCPPGERLFFNWVADAVNGAAAGDYVQQGRVCVGPTEAADLEPADGGEPVVL